MTNGHFRKNNHAKRPAKSNIIDMVEKRLTEILVSLRTTEAAVQGVLRKRCSKNMQQIYRRTPIPKCDFNKVAKQLY